MKRIQYAVIVLAASVILLSVAVIVPAAIALAQDEELTLAGLAEQVTALAGRVAALESLTADPWAPDVIYTDDGICQSPLHTKGRYSWAINGEIRQETADAYRTAYGTSIDPEDDVYLASIAFATEGNHVYLEYAKDNHVVVETWANCEFVGHSEWEEEE